MMKSLKDKVNELRIIEDEKVPSNFSELSRKERRQYLKEAVKTERKIIKDFVKIERKDNK